MLWGQEGYKGFLVCLVLKLSSKNIVMEFVTGPADHNISFLCVCVCVVLYGLAHCSWSIRYWPPAEFAHCRSTVPMQSIWWGVHWNFCGFSRVKSVSIVGGVDSFLTLVNNWAFFGPLTHNFFIHSSSWRALMIGANGRFPKLIHHPPKFLYTAKTDLLKWQNIFVIGDASLEQNYFC